MGPCDDLALLPGTCDVILILFFVVCVVIPVLCVWLVVRECFRQHRYRKELTEAFDKIEEVNGELQKTLKDSYNIVVAEALKDIHRTGEEMREKIKRDADKTLV
jgi:uncharacterized membrane-anchored protein YhcB (DUF1043 family)